MSRNSASQACEICCPMRSENMRSSISRSSTRLMVCQLVAACLRRAPPRGAVSSRTLVPRTSLKVRFSEPIFRRNSMCMLNIKSRSAIRVADCDCVPMPVATLSATAAAVSVTWRSAASRAAGSRESVEFIRCWAMGKTLSRWLPGLLRAAVHKVSLQTEQGRAARQRGLGHKWTQASQRRDAGRTISSASREFHATRPRLRVRSPGSPGLRA